MTLANELREVTDEVIKGRIEAANLKILNEMWDTARVGDHYVIYSTAELSKELINYLDKQGLNFYGRFSDNCPWHSIYPTKDIFSMYNKIMIAW